MLEILSTIDWVIAGVAVSMVLFLVLRALRAAPSADLLAEAPDRGQIVGEDILALPILAYLVAVAVLATVVRWIDGDSAGALSGLVVGSGAQIVGLGVCLFIVAGRFDGGVVRFLIGGNGGHEPSGDTGGHVVQGPPCDPGGHAGYGLPSRSDSGTGDGGIRGSFGAGGRPGTARAYLVVFLCILLALGLCFLVLGATERALRFLIPDYEFSAHPTMETLCKKDQPIGVVVGLWIGAAGLAPLAEEVFFRGLLQTYLVNLLRHRWRAIGLTSIGFAAVHVSQPHAIPALMLLSFVLGYAYERTGALVSPVLIHAIFNLKTLIWSALAGVEL